MTGPWLHRAFKRLFGRIPDSVFRAIPDDIVEHFPLVESLRSELRHAEVRALTGAPEGPTEFRDRFQRAITYYEEGRYEEARAHFRALRDDENTTILGPTKFIYLPSEAAQTRLGIYQPVIVYDDLDATQKMMYMRANEFLDSASRPETFRVLDLRDKMDGMLVAEFLDAVPADSFLARYPEPAFARVLYDHCIDSGALLHENLYSDDLHPYPHEEKLAAAFGRVHKRAGEAIEAIADRLSKQRTMQCVDRHVGNNFVDLMTRPHPEYLRLYSGNPLLVDKAERESTFEPIRKLKRFSSEDEAITTLLDDIERKYGTGERTHFRDAIITHDFETLDTRSDPGHILGDIVTRTPFPLRDLPGPAGGSLEDHVYRRFAERFGVPLDDDLMLGLTARSIRMASRFGPENPHIIEHAARLVSTSFGVNLKEPSLDGILHALGAYSKEIRTAVRSPIRLSGTAW